MLDVRSKRLAGVALGVMSLALAPGAVRAEAVGTAGAANTRSSGTAPGGAVKLIEIGEQVVRDEKIETSGSGSVQVVFIDKTTLNIGPNSVLVIDKFVFNPATSTGAMALTLGRGVLRVVGGQATHSGGATVTTPVATIGIRGGIATISHFTDGTVPPPADTGHHHHGHHPHAPGTASQLSSQFASLWSPPGTHVVLHFGRIEVTSNGVTETIVRPGFGTFVTSIGGVPTQPARVSQAEIDSANALLTSKGTQTGGTRNNPTDQTASRLGLGGYNRDASTTTPPRQGQTVATGTGRTNVYTPAGSGNSLEQGVSSAAASRTADEQPPPPGPPPPPPPPPPPSSPLSPPPPPPVTGPAPAAYMLTTTAGAGSRIPFLTASFVTAGTAHITPIYGYRAGGLDANGQPSTISRNFQASFAIHGSGASQSSTLAVATSAIAQVGTQYIQSGAFAATSRDSSHPFGNTANGGWSSTTQAPAPAAVPTDPTGLPTAAFPTTQNDLSFDTRTGQLQAFASTASDGSVPSYTYNQTITPLTAPAGLGKNHPNLVLQGYAGGIGQGGVGSKELPSYIITNATGMPGDVSITLYGNLSRMAATFNVRKLDTTETTGELQTASLKFGVPLDTASTTYDTNRGAYVDLTHFAALSQRTFIGVGSHGQDTTTVNGQAFGSGSGLDLMLVNAQSLDVPAAFPGVTFCQCDYTQWGMWSASGFRPVSSDKYAFDSTGIAFWVAGQPAAAADVNSQIANNVTATYTGHVIASIANGVNEPADGYIPSQYIAAGNLTNTVNFGTRSGIVSIPNLDGWNYGGLVRFGTNPTLFSGTLSTTAGEGGPVMNVNGSFYKGAASPVGEMGGSVTINGYNYLGSGIFAAKMR